MKIREEKKLTMDEIIHDKGKGEKVDGYRKKN